MSVSKMDLETYSKKITDFLAGGYIAFSIRLGKDLGLFDELKRLDKPVSSQQLADACNYKERYVREWLGCMVSTEIVSMDENNKYFIPQSLKPGLDALGFSFFLPVMSPFSDKAKECFKKDGPEGFGYQDMPKGVVEAVEEKTGDAGDVLIQLLKPMTKPIESLTTILDLGCGGGCLSRALGKRFPKADIYAVDYNDEALMKAKASSKTQGIVNVNFVKEDVARMPADWKGKFDWVIMLDVLHDLPAPDKTMKEVRRVLKDDGVVSIVDPDLHSDHRQNVGDASLAGVGYALSTVICLPCSLSIPNAAGHGMGWGTENKEKFLTSSGWEVKDKRNIDSPFALNFTCVKA